VSHESQRALERIVAICERSGNLTMRQIRIFDIALEGLGYVARQREEILAQWKQPHLDEIAARRERQMARAAELERAA
jgi:ABC-type phosphate transport system auxiliary subunit